MFWGLRCGLLYGARGYHHLTTWNKATSYSLDCPPIRVYASFVATLKSVLSKQFECWSAMPSPAMGQISLPLVMCLPLLTSHLYCTLPKILGWSIHFELHWGTGGLSWNGPSETQWAQQTGALACGVQSSEETLKIFIKLLRSEVLYYWHVKYISSLEQACKWMWCAISGVFMETRLNSYME